MNLEVGQIVRARSRQYLVEEVIAPPCEGDTQVRLSCLEDDAQGQQLEVFWEREVDAQIMGYGERRCHRVQSGKKKGYYKSLLALES